MIPRHSAIRAVVAYLADALDPTAVALQRAPARPPSSYIVVRTPPGSTRTGGITAPVDWVRMRVDLLAVATASTEDLAATEAHRLADLAVTALFDYGKPIQGNGWSASGREFIADSGILIDANEAGATANITTAVELYVVTASPTP